MGFFKKKDKYEDIDMTVLDEDSFYIGTKRATEKAPKHHSLTADEIIGENNAYFYAPTEAPLESLRKKMIARNKPSGEEKEEEIKSFFNIDSSFLDEPLQQESRVTKQNEEVLIPDIALIKEEETAKEIEEEIQFSKIQIPEPEIRITEPEKSKITAPLNKDETVTFVPDEVSESKEEESLLQNCLPFIMDGNNGEYVPNDKPSYTLDSVASILGIEEPEEETKQETQEDTEARESDESPEKTMVFEAITPNKSLPDISDIDNESKGGTKTDIAATATMPVIIPDEMISSTRDVDISEEFFQNKVPADLGMSEAQVQQEYESFTPEVEYKSKNDRKKIRIKLLAERRSRFLKVVGSMLALLILGVFALPAFSDTMLSFSPKLAVFTGISFLLALVCNRDIFLSLPSVLTKRASAESGISFSVIISAVTILLSVVKQLPGEVYYGIGLMTVLSLVFRSYFRFKRSQYIYTNFLRISADKDKYGIILIDDVPTTFAMSRKAIDGDVLIAAPKRTRNITDFMKNSTFDVDLDGRARLIFIIGIVFSLLAGVAFGFYRSSFMTGAVATCAFASLFAPLTTLACSVLPLSSAAAHLNRYGAVLTGLRAAKQIEEANACVIDCDTLFPKGSVKLVNMKVMAQNNLEETIACACAITTNIKSPLAPVFKTVMETNKSVEIPVADSIKYEERLGVTGWVGNKRIFIGNRALMLAHEIPVPDAENDKKLMRDGYFPVYVACDGKACALLVLKYIPNPDIAKELDRISAMGLTILINNCDQNISEEMVCDYFDLYSDSIKMMSGSGVHMYKTAVTFEESMNAGAVIKKGAAGMAAVVYCANRVKKANSILQIAHIISIVLGVIIFAYIVFPNAYANCIYVALYQLACFILSGIAYLFTKP